MEAFSAGYYTKGSVWENQPFESLGDQLAATCRLAVGKSEFETIESPRYNPQKNDKYPIFSRESGLPVKGPDDCCRIPK
jgi:hypothetical protein